MRAVLVLACACHAAIPAVPGQGGPAWHEVTSEHFVGWTDGDVDDARALIQTVEHLRQVELVVMLAASSHDEAARAKMCAAVSKNPAVLPKWMCP